jgi:hypothetical protein
MDQDVVRFRRAAARENRGRRDVRRRYSAPLQQQAVDYWRVRERAGDDLRDVAAALRVAPWSLRRWTQEARFHPVHVVPEPAHGGGGLAVIIREDSVRVEGLDLELVVQLVARLR